MKCLSHTFRIYDSQRDSFQFSLSLNLAHTNWDPGGYCPTSCKHGHSRKCTHFVSKASYFHCFLRWNEAVLNYARCKAYVETIRQRLL